MLKLRRLKINLYRNVEPCELFFDDGFNVVLGKNASGKTSFLKLLTAVLRASFDLLTEPYDLEGEFEYTGTLWEGTGAKFHFQANGNYFDSRQMLPQFTVPFEPEEMVHNASMKCLVGEGVKFVIQRSSDGTLSAQAEGSSPVSLRVRAASLFWAFRFLRFNPDWGGWVFRFDETNESFLSMTSGYVGEFDIFPPNELAIVRWDDPEMEPTATTNFPFPDSMISVLKNAINPDLRVIEIAPNNAVFVRKFLEESDEFQDARCLFYFLRSERHESSTVFYFRPMEFYFRKQNGSTINQKMLSYGQKRLLSFLYYLDVSPTFVVADELVNGLHHSWIDKAMEMIPPRQAFLTSQNPILFDYLPMRSAEEARRCFIVCERVPGEKGDKLRWRNLDEVDARRIYDAYEVGIETLGQILETRGVW